jgi:VWFA-related protein
MKTYRIFCWCLFFYLVISAPDVFSQTQAEKLRIGILIDNSGSMRVKFDQIIETGLSLVDELQGDDQAFVVRFIGQDKTEVVQDWTDEKTPLHNAIEGMYVEGGKSAITDALYASAEELLKKSKDDANARYALIIITDGEDRDSRYKTDKLFELLRGSSVKIYPIALVNLASEPKKATGYVQKLASETKGKALITQSLSRTEMDKTVKAVFADLRNTETTPSQK